MIKFQYDSQDDVPEAHAELYVEKDGKWVLSVEGLPSSDSVSRLENTLKKVRKDLKAAEDKSKALAKLGDRDVDEVLSQLDELEELKAAKEAGGGKDEEAIAKRVEAGVAAKLKPLQRELDKYKAEATEAKTKAEELGTRIRTTTIDSELTAAATAAKVRHEAIADVHLHRGIFELSEEGKVVTRDGVGVTPGLSPAEWLGSEMKEKRPHWWAESTGGGARGGDGKSNGGGNPFDKKAPNITLASKIISSDKTKADNLARAAGHRDADAAIDFMGRQAVQ